MLSLCRTARVWPANLRCASLPNVSNVKGMSSELQNVTYLEIPSYPVDKAQSLEIRKARLLYQSRKRGMLENDLLLSTFAGKHLRSFTEDQTMQYDRLINTVSNDWDLFYWIIGKKPTPPPYDNEVMRMLQKHALNAEREARRQPELHA